MGNQQGCGRAPVAGAVSFVTGLLGMNKPSSYVPGTRMIFAGISNDQQRADVIAYLRSLSPTPVSLSAP